MGNELLQVSIVFGKIFLLLGAVLKAKLVPLRLAKVSCETLLGHQRGYKRLGTSKGQEDPRCPPQGCN